MGAWTWYWDIELFFDIFFGEQWSLKMRELPPQVGNFGGENQDKPWGFQTNANGIVFRCFYLDEPHTETWLKKMQLQQWQLGLLCSG